MEQKKRLHFSTSFIDEKSQDSEGNNIVWSCDFIVDDNAPLAFCYGAAVEFLNKMVGFINNHNDQTKAEVEEEPQCVEEECCEEKEEE